MRGLEAYQKLNEFRLAENANWEKFRFVSLDCESTGLDPRKDALVSIGGISVCEGEICLWDQFSVVMPIAFNTASVTVHGITREASSEGLEEPLALDQFLGWLGDGIIVGHHIQHDLTLLNTALERHFSIQLTNLTVDTMEAWRVLRASGGFGNKDQPFGYGLDALCQLFGIVTHDRHTALGDAFLTAQVLLRLLKEARALGKWNLADLHAWYGDQQFPFAEIN